MMKSNEAVWQEKCLQVWLHTGDRSHSTWMEQFRSHTHAWGARYMAVFRRVRAFWDGIESWLGSNPRTGGILASLRPGASEEGIRMVEQALSRQGAHIPLELCLSLRMHDGQTDL